MISEARKKANQKWDAENMTSIALKVTKKFKAQLEEVCNSRGMTVHAGIKQAIEEWIAKE